MISKTSRGSCLRQRSNSAAALPANAPDTIPRRMGMGAPAPPERRILVANWISSRASETFLWKKRPCSVSRIFRPTFSNRQTPSSSSNWRMALLRDGWVIPSRAAAWGCARKSKIEQYCVSYLQKLQNGDRFYYLSPFWCLQQNFISKFIVILSYSLPNLIAYTEIPLNYAKFIHTGKR